MIEQLLILAAEFNGNARNLGVPDTRATGGVLNSIISATFVAVGAIALLFLILGAGRYIISQGDEGDMQKAKDTILYSIVGLIVAVSAFLIVQFITNRIV